MSKAVAVKLRGIPCENVDTSNVKFCGEAVAVNACPVFVKVICKLFMATLSENVTGIMRDTPFPTPTAVPKVITGGVVSGGGGALVTLMVTLMVPFEGAGEPPIVAV